MSQYFYWISGQSYFLKGILIGGFKANGYWFQEIMLSLRNGYCRISVVFEGCEGDQGQSSRIVFSFPIKRRSNKEEKLL